MSNARVFPIKKVKSILLKFTEFIEFKKLHNDSEDPSNENNNASVSVSMNTIC